MGTPRWLPCASQPQDMDTIAMDTTTARKLPKRPATTPQLLPPLSPLLRLPTLSQSRPASTSQLTSQSSPARTSLLRNVSPSQRSKKPLPPWRSASPSWEPPPAPLLSSPSPSRSARRSTTDMLRTPMMSSHTCQRPQLHTMLKNNNPSLSKHYYPSASLYA